MKTPIEPSEIRAGDHIRLEYTRSENGSPRAMEYVAEHDGMAMRKRMNAAERLTARYVLTKRPEIPGLPTEDHHFGWLSADQRLGRPNVPGEWFFGDPITASGFSDGISRNSVTAWRPGTLVPTAALDGLREKHSGTEVPLRCVFVGDFLAAVDEANS